MSLCAPAGNSPDRAPRIPHQATNEGEYRPVATPHGVGTIAASEADESRAITEDAIDL
jgi:hypothetical protein